MAGLAFVRSIEQGTYDPVSGGIVMTAVTSVVHASFGDGRVEPTFIFEASDTPVSLRQKVTNAVVAACQTVLGLTISPQDIVLPTFQKGS